MMTLHINEYYAPSKLEEALQILSEKEVKIGCGCTDMIPQLRDGKFPEISLLDLKNLVKDYSGVRLETKGISGADIQGACLVIGAMTPHDTLAENPLLRKYMPMLSDACGQIGSAQVRKRGTIGGNILNASPAADSVPALMAADAWLHLISKDGERYAKLNGFASRPGRTDIHKDEILLEVIVPVENGAFRGAFMKVGPRNAMIISVADAAVLYDPVEGYRIACGSVAATVVRAYETEKLFNEAGTTCSKKDVACALSKDICPIDDIRATGSYRLKVLVNLLHNYYEYQRPSDRAER